VLGGECNVDRLGLLDFDLPLVEPYVEDVEVMQKKL
jgi:hypothetical protein